MTREEYNQVLAGLAHGTPSLETYRRAMEYDSNFEWRMSQGHIINLLDMALEEIEQLTKGLAQAWDQGYRDSNREWDQCWDLVTPDEERFVAKNPYPEGDA